MTGKPRTIACLGALACGIAVPAWAATANTSTQDLQKQISQLKAQVAQLQQSQDSNWLNAQRAEQVKGLIRDVLADSKTRSTLLSEGATAGYDPDSGFFLASADDAFRVNVHGLMQLRYIWNNGQHNTDGSDRNQNGFQIPLLSLRFDGHVSNPRLTYRLWLAEVDESDIYAREAWINYQIDDNWSVRVGRARVPFTRETLVDEENQLAVNRSTVDSVFGAGYATGATGFYTNGNVKVALSFDEGNGVDNDGFSNYYNGEDEYALTARADVKLAGNWEQEEDFNTFSGEPQSAFVGGAVRYANGDNESANGSDTNTFAATVDGSYTNNGLTAYGALFYRNDDNKDAADSNAYGALAQAGYSINDKWEPFARWEMVKQNIPGLNTNFQAITVGVNYFLNKNRAKITTDLVWAYQGTNLSGVSDDLTGLANLTGDGDGLALRAQFQLMF